MVKVAFITVLTCSNFSGAAKQAVVDLPPEPSQYMKSYPPAPEAVFGNPWRIA